MELLTLIARLGGLEAHRKQAIQRASTRYAGPLHIHIPKQVLWREGKKGEHFIYIANKCLNGFEAGPHKYWQIKC